MERTRKTPGLSYMAPQVLERKTVLQSCRHTTYNCILLSPPLSLPQGSTLKSLPMALGF